MQFFARITLIDGVQVVYGLHDDVAIRADAIKLGKLRVGLLNPFLLAKCRVADHILRRDNLH